MNIRIYCTFIGKAMNIGIYHAVTEHNDMNIYNVWLW